MGPNGSEWRSNNWFVISEDRGVFAIISEVAKFGLIIVAIVSRAVASVVTIKLRTILTVVVLGGVNLHAS